MRKERYKLEVGKTPMTFEFTSKGDKGLIKKRVIFIFYKNYVNI